MRCFIGLMQMKKDVLSFDPSFSSHYCGTFYVNIAKTLNPGSCPGFHDAVCYSVDKEEETVKNKSAGFCTDHSSTSRSIGFEEERSPTIRNGVIPAVCISEPLKANTIRVIEKHGFDWYQFGGFKESKKSGVITSGTQRLRGGTTIVVEIIK